MSLQQLRLPLLTLFFCIVAMLVFVGQTSAEGEPGARFPDPGYTTNYANFGDPSVGNVLYLSVGYGEHISGATTAYIYPTGSGVVDIIVEEATACYRAQPGGSGTVDIPPALRWDFTTWYYVYAPSGALVASTNADTTCTTNDRLLQFSVSGTQPYRFVAEVVNNGNSGENLFKLRRSNGPGNVGIGPQDVGGFSLSNRDLLPGYESSYGVYFATACTGSTIGAGGLNFYDADFGIYQSTGSYPDLFVVLARRQRGSSGAWINMGSRTLTGGDRGWDSMPAVSFPPDSEFRLQIFNLTRPNALEVSLASGLSAQNVGVTCTVTPTTWNYVHNTFSINRSGSQPVGTVVTASGNVRNTGNDYGANNWRYQLQQRQQNAVGTWSGWANIQDNQNIPRLNAFQNSSTYSQGFAIPAAYSGSQVTQVCFRAYLNPAAGETTPVFTTTLAARVSAEQCVSVQRGWEYVHNSFSANSSSPIVAGSTLSPRGRIQNTQDGNGADYRYRIQARVQNTAGAWSTRSTFHDVNATGQTGNSTSGFFTGSYSVPTNYNGSRVSRVCFMALVNPYTGQSTPSLTITSSGTRDTGESCVDVLQPPSCSASDITFYRFNDSATAVTTMPAGMNFRSQVNVANPNGSSLTVNNVSYSIARSGGGMPASSTNTSRSFNNPGNINASSSRVYKSYNGNQTNNTADVRLDGPGTYTITWSITTPASPTPTTCARSVTMTVDPVLCSAGTLNFNVGEVFNATMSISNSANLVGISVVPSPSFVIRNAGGATVATGSSTWTPNSTPGGGSIAVTGSNAQLMAAGVYTIDWSANISFGVPGFTNVAVDAASCAGKTINILQTPYNRFYSNDVISCDEVNGNGSGSVYGAFRGSASQLAILAANSITNTLSGSQYTARSSVKDLAFANSGAGTFGGNFASCSSGSGFSFTDINAMATHTYSGGNINSLTGGGFNNDPRVYRHTNLSNHVVFGPVDAGEQFVVYAPGNLHIGNPGGGANKNIIANEGAWNNLWDIPSMTIIADGNIYIHSSMTRLDANLIASGDVFTCYTASNDDLSSAVNGSAAAADLVSSCGNPLVINGAVSARRIHFLRLRGDVALATAPNEPAINDPATPSNIAEVMNFRIEALLGGVKFSDPPEPNLDSIVTRPVTF